MMATDSDRDRATMQKLVERYIDGLSAEFQSRWDQWPVTIENPGPSEVTIGLLRRQYSLAMHIATAPNLWTPEIAPILLRCMVEVYITLAWILIEPEERSKKFIEYGLGQEKLIIKHRNDEAADQGLDIDDDPINQEAIEWLEGQKYSFLIDVELGSWSGLDARRMAEEADCLDFYRYTYPRFSTVVHSTWNHISRYDLLTCMNPLHGGHHIPRTWPLPISTDFLRLAAKYMDKTFGLVDSKLGLEKDVPSTYCDMFLNDSVPAADPSAVNNESQLDALKSQPNYEPN
jgi:hypothetical protein